VRGRAEGRNRVEKNEVRVGVGVRVEVRGRAKAEARGRVRSAQGAVDVGVYAAGIQVDQ